MQAPSDHIRRTYRNRLTQAGLEVNSQQFMPAGDGGHALFWARLKPSDSPQACNHAR